MQNVEAMLYAAEKYDLEILKTQCDTFLSSINKANTNALVSLGIAQKYNLEDLEQQCMTAIANNATMYLNSDDFCNLSQDVVKLIAECEKLCIGELELYNAVMTWAEFECSRKNLCYCDDHIKEVLGPVLYSIRFPLFDGKVFCEEMDKRNILTQSEINEVLKYVVTKKQPNNTVFNFTSRTKPISGPPK